VRACNGLNDFFRCSPFRVADADIWRWQALKAAQVEYDTERAKAR
jgi:hypothetical protein